MVRKNLNQNAQISLDYLLGVTIFLLAFIFVFAFIPGMFSPFHSNSDEVTMAADRVAATLVENTLAHGGPGEKQPSILDASSISQFQAQLANPATSSQLRQSLGLNTSGNSQYNLEVIIEEQGQTPLDFSNGQQPGGSNVGQSRRYVLVQDQDGSGIDNYPGRSAIVTVRVW